MLPVRYDWIFSRHCAGSTALSPARRLSHAERFRPLMGVPVVVSVTLNFTFASSPALTLVAFFAFGSRLNSIAIPCSTIFCARVGLAGSCACTATAPNNKTRTQAE